MAKNVYGLDLGSYEIKVYDKKSDTIWKEKNVIAIKEDREIFAVGDQAYEMYEKTPPEYSGTVSNGEWRYIQI